MIQLQPHPETPPYAKDIPTRTLGSIARYVLQGKHPGDFVRACLCNNLHLAVGYADSDNVAALKPIVMLMFNRLPRHCWGNEDKFDEWRDEIKCPEFSKSIADAFPYLVQYLDS